MSEYQGVIRSIRIATLLNERIALLVKPRSYEDGAGGAMSFHLSELRQIYPEVWANLDHARAELAKHGVDVPRYDEIRRSPVTNAGGVLAVQLDPGDGVQKQAQLNTAGHGAAIEACGVLRAAIPGMTYIAWENLMRAEREEMAAAAAAAVAEVEAARPPAWKRHMFTWILVLLFAGIAVLWMLVG